MNNSFDQIQSDSCNFNAREAYEAMKLDDQIQSLFADCRSYGADMYDMELEIQFNLPEDLHDAAWDELLRLEEAGELWEEYYC